MRTTLPLRFILLFHHGDVGRSLQHVGVLHVATGRTSRHAAAALGGDVHCLEDGRAREHVHDRQPLELGR